MADEMHEDWKRAEATGPDDPLYPRPVRLLAEAEEIRDIEARRLSIWPLFAGRLAGRRFLLPDAEAAERIATGHGCRWRLVLVATGDARVPETACWATLEEAPPALAVRRWVAESEGRRAVQLTADGRALPVGGGQAFDWRPESHVEVLRLIDPAAVGLLWAGKSVPAEPEGRHRRVTPWPADDSRPPDLTPRVFERRLHPPEADADEAEVAELTNLRHNRGGVRYGMFETKYLIAVLKELGRSSTVSQRLEIARRVAKASSGWNPGVYGSMAMGIGLANEMERLNLTRRDLPYP